MKKILIPFFCGILLLFACETFQKKEDENNLKSGEENARLFCGSCHQFPEPDLLTKSMWKDEVLPKMAQFMGLFANPQERESLIEQNAGGLIVKSQNIFPAHPLIDSNTFNSIIDWYISKAPEQLDYPEIPASSPIPYFNVEKGPADFHPPSTTLVKIEDNGNLLFGDANTSLFQRFNKQLKPELSAELIEAPVHALKYQGYYYITCMGSFSPTDLPGGLMVKIPAGAKGKGGIVIDSLQRPVHSQIEDLDKDGNPDFIVCEFGKYTGALNVYTDVGKTKPRKITLLAKPGAVKTYIRDMNNDGKKDIVALFAQADEGIDIFYNQGNHQYKRNRVLSFPPGFGSSSFHLIDYNRDGFEDILYTAGDNADFKHMLRPYHGIYIYLNSGKNSFVKKHFIHLPGAYDAHPIDLNQDGHLDIAAISFFPDWTNADPQGFIVYENQGTPYNFRKMHLQEGLLGRWIVMDSGDIDKDGDMDVVLGSLTMETVPDLGLIDKWKQGGIPFIVLRNNSK